MFSRLFRFVGTFLCVGVLLFVAGCDESSRFVNPPPDVDISGTWAFTGLASVGSCTTDALTNQFTNTTRAAQDFELCDFTVDVTQVGGSFTSTIGPVGCEYSFDTAALSQTQVPGTSAFVEGQLLGENLGGPVTRVFITFEGGATESRFTFSPLLLWDADANNGDPLEVCADDQSVLCDSDDDPTSCEANNACEAFGGRGIGGPVAGSCAMTGASCLLSCSDDAETGCFTDTDCDPVCVAGFCSDDSEEACVLDSDCTSEAECVDDLLSCPDLGSCIEATCSFSGQKEADR